MIGADTNSFLAVATLSTLLRRSLHIAKLSEKIAGRQRYYQRTRRWGVLGVNQGRRNRWGRKGVTAHAGMTIKLRHYLFQREW